MATLQKQREFWLLVIDSTDWFTVATLDGVAVAQFCGPGQYAVTPNIPIMIAE